MELAKRLSLINESSTLRMSKLSRELSAQGHQVINLSVGESDLDTPKHIIEAAHEAMLQGYTRYSPVAGYQDLREAIANYYNQTYHSSYSAAHVLVSTGAKHTLMNIILSVVNPGEKVLLPAPYWVSYPEMVKFAEGELVIPIADISQDYKLTPSQLEEGLAKGIKLVVFCSPGNPTGAVYTREELDVLVSVLEKYPETLIISDEIYEHLVFEGTYTSMAEYPSIANRLIVVNGVSKGFAMTGWRIGYMLAPEPIVKACEKLQGQFTSGANSIAQRATLAALTQSLEPTKKMTEIFKTRRDLFLEELKGLEGFVFNKPNGAFYLFADVSAILGKTFHGESIQNTEDLCMYLLNKAHVTMVAGDGFGLPNCVRMSYATSETNLIEAAKRLKKALS
jgi:aspartate aminotransferase